jgi:hypothetical protein
MSQTEDTAPIDRQSVEQTVGIFPTDAALQNAVGRLSTAGYSRNRLVTPAFDTQAALTDAAKTEEDTRQLRTLRSSTTAAAASMAGAATV